MEDRTVTADDIAIGDRLLREGQRLLDAPPEFVQFTGKREADELLNDLRGRPHAYVLACVMDRQIKAEKAWFIPHQFREKLGDFEFETLRALPRQQIERIMTRGKMHRFPKVMSENFHAAVKRIGQVYNGDAAAMWEGEPPSAAVVYRFLKFDGIGPKIATMAANILARNFKIKFADYYSVDISGDVHVKRVFARLGLVSADAGVEQVVYRARMLSPTFPGLLDLPVWEIGRQWCRPKDPICGECHMRDVCPKIPADSTRGKTSRSRRGEWEKIATAS
jgi:endonuclease-3